MRTNQVKEKLKRGEPVLGGWLSLPGVASARVLARLGFDWLAIDTTDVSSLIVEATRQLRLARE